MQNDEFLRQLLERMTSSITASTVRRQGPSGTMAEVQEFLADPSFALAISRASDPETFRRILDQQTEKLQKAMPDAEEGHLGGYWGTARKCLNIFLFECFLNRFLCPKYDLARLETWLEVPLDSLVGTGLKDDAQKLLGRKIDAWNTIKNLNEAASDGYQGVASEIAAKCQTPRVHLELRYWKRAQRPEKS